MTTVAVKKTPLDGSARSLFPTILVGVLALETAFLILTPVPVPREMLPPPEPLKVTLAPAPPAPPKPQPKPHPRSTPKITRKAVVKRPVQVPTLPVQTATSTNLLVASAGTSVNMNWGESAPSQAAGSGYQPPVLLSRVDTDALYTEKMKADDEEGDVVVDLWIDASGKILRSKMVVPSVWDDMNRIAAGVLARLKFSPALLKGQPVAGKFELNFRFRIRNSG